MPAITFAVLLTFLVAACSDSATYTLYRSSPVGADMRLHVATFDANEAQHLKVGAHVLQALLFC